MSPAPDKRAEVSRKLAADMESGREYPLLRSFYGLGRVTAKARANIASSLKQAGLDVLSDPNNEPLVVAKRTPAHAAPTPGSSGESPGRSQRPSLLASAVLVLLVVVGIALSGGDEEPKQASNFVPPPTTNTTSDPRPLPPDPAELLADAQQAVRDDNYDQALAIMGDSGGNAERRILGSIAM